MDAIDLLNDIGDLPRTASGGHYINHLRDALFTYARAAAALTATDAASTQIRNAAGKIQKLAEQLITVHDACLRGDLPAAGVAMGEAIHGVRDELDILLSVPLDRDRLGIVYRIRIGDPSEGIDRGGLFHISFDIRHIVSPMRYSMLGIPMLYLGQTLFCCLEELGRPPVERVWVTAMRLREGKTVRVIDLGYRPAHIAAMLNQAPVNEAKSNFAASYAVVWPLVAACSFRKRHSDPRFAEEYIIPQQLVAHLVRTREFDGIRYFSNRVDSYEGPLLHMNFVFPARLETAAGYCPRLVELFEMTPPMPWTMVSLLGPALNRGDPLNYSRPGILEAIPGHKVWYPNTGYAKIESYLRDQDFEPVC